MNASNSDPQPGWEEIRPLLDEALTKLAPADRDALLLRYFEQRDFAGVGAALGASAEAARKRVDRALDRLRDQLVKRGIRTTAAALGGALTAHAVETVPVGLVISLASGAAATAASGAGGWISNLLIMTKAKIAISAALLAGILATPLLIQQQVLATARAEQSDWQARLRNLPAQAVSPAGPVSGLIDFAARDRADLERLRLEAPALRARLAELTAQAQQLAAAHPWHKPDGNTLGDVLRPRDVRDAGQATPEATMQTFLWAMLQGDTNRIPQLLVFEAGGDGQQIQEKLGKVLQELAKESADMRSDADADATDHLAVHLLEEQPGQNDDRWVLTETTESDGTVEAPRRILLRPTDMGWKWVVGTNGNPVEEPITDQP